MIEKIIFWLAVIFASLWTLNWLRYMKMSRGHFWAIGEVVALWAVVVFFAFNPNISRFHMLWVTPIAFFGVDFILMPLVRLFTKDRRRDID